MICLLWRLLFGMCGLKWLTRPSDPDNEAETQRWRARRRQFRNKVRTAMVEFLAADEAGA